MNAVRSLPASRAPEFPPTSRPRAHGSAGLAGCVFSLTVTLCVIFLTGSAPFVKAWLLGAIAW